VIFHGVGRNRAALVPAHNYNYNYKTKFKPTGAGRALQFHRQWLRYIHCPPPSIPRRPLRN